METEEEFPVAVGTVVTLSCVEGYLLTGDEEVTCAINTEFDYSVEFKYSTEPRCGTISTILSKIIK